MNFQHLFIGYFILMLNEGLDSGSRIPDEGNTTPIAMEGDLLLPLCRIVRNARNALLEKVHAVYSDPDFLKSCVISNSCTSLLCSTSANKEESFFGWNLNLCDAKLGPSINFLLNSASIANSTWSYLALPSTEHQRTNVPLQQSPNGVVYYLNVIFLRWFSQLHGSDKKWSTLSLDVSIEVCNRTCDSTWIFRDIRFPLRQLCQFEFSESVPGNLLKSGTEQVQIPSPVTSHIGMPCSLQNPFKCGINSVCRRHEGGGEDEGICDCCDSCELFANGTCSSRTGTSTEVPSNGSHEADSSTVVTGVGSFLAIVSLFLLGGGIYYSVKYNVFPRVQNRLRIYWTSRCSGRVVGVTDRGNLCNPLYDDDEPALL